MATKVAAPMTTLRDVIVIGIQTNMVGEGVGKMVGI
jgi:hypothetical protein